MKSKFQVFFMVLIVVSQTAPVQTNAQESEFKDTQWFSGVPSYYNYDAERTYEAGCYCNWCPGYIF